MHMDKLNMVCTHNGVIFGHKKEKVLIHATTWLNLENMLNEISLTHKDKYCTVLLVSLE